MELRLCAESRSLSVNVILGNRTGHMTQNQGLPVEALGSCQSSGLFLTQSCLKIEWPTLQRSELIVIRDVQTRTA